MDINIGDTVELEGKQGVVVKVGRIGIPSALTIRWIDTGIINVYLYELECKKFTKVE